MIRWGENIYCEYDIDVYVFIGVVFSNNGVYKGVR